MEHDIEESKSAKELREFRELRKREERDWIPVLVLIGAIIFLLITDNLPRHSTGDEGYNCTSRYDPDC